MEQPKSKLEQFYSGTRKQLDIFPSRASDSKVKLELGNTEKEAGNLILSKYDVQPFLGYVHPDTREIYFCGIRKDITKERFAINVFLHIKWSTRGEKNQN